MEEYQGTYERIIQGCIRRERSAQASFYDLFAQHIHATAYRMLDSVGEAEEVVQNVLLRTLTSPTLLLPDSADMARMLRRMAINECIDCLRKKHITWEKLDEQTDLCEEQSLDETLLKEERSEQLRYAILALPPQSRTVLQLAVMEEMEYEEIASLLHITNSNVRAHLTRAKQKLINWFKDERWQL